MLTATTIIIIMAMMSGGRSAQDQVVNEGKYNLQIELGMNQKTQSSQYKIFMFEFPRIKTTNL